MDKVYRPAWVEPVIMKQLGYKLLSDKDGYLKYANEGGTEGTYYGPMWRDKRIIYFNTTFQPHKEVVFVGIMEDGDTRTVFNGAIGDQELFIKIMNSVV